MSLISYKLGQGSIVLRVKILDSSAATGAGKNELTHTSTGLRIAATADNEATATAYTAGATIETIATLGTYAAPSADCCRFRQFDATNHPGVYEIQLADSRLGVSGAKSLMVSISGATNAAETDVVIPLTALDPYDPQRAGLAALPSSGTFPANFASLTISAAGLVAIDNATLVDAIWDEATSGHTTSGTTGKAVADAQSAGDPWATAIPGNYAAGTAGEVLGNFLASDPWGTDIPAGNYGANTAGHILGTYLDATVSSRSTLDAANAAAAVWDEDLTGHTTANSAGLLLSEASTGGDPWSTALPGSYTSGQAGYIVGTNLNATISSRSTLAAGAQMDLVNAPNATALSAIAAAVWAATTRTLTSLGTLVADMADAVWDELLSGHTTAGSMGARFATLARAGEVTATSPVSSDGTVLALVIGYAYSEANGNPILWTDKTGFWPDLSGATLALRVFSKATSGDLFTVTGTAVNPGTSSQSVRFAVTAEQTSQFAEAKNVYVFFVECSVTVSGTTTTSCLVRGWVNPTIAPTKNPYCGT